MKFSDFLKQGTVYLDGGMGTLLQAKGLKPGEYPERWNISHPEVISEIHRDYFDAGSNVVCTNTFGANGLKFCDAELEAIVKAAINNADTARKQSVNRAPKFIALDIGPSGKLLKPLGDLDFEDAVALFAKTVKLGVIYGADLIVIETMNDSYETKAALLAAKENSTLPVIVTNAYGEDGKLMTGARPAAMVAMLEGMGADAIGTNCSLGPRQLRGVVEELLENASVPVVFKPNAGIPRSVDGRTVYDVTVDEFAGEIAQMMKKGVRVMGGCCGTTPEYIKALVGMTRDIAPVPLCKKNLTVVSSYTHAVKFGMNPVVIGGRINPTGKKRLQEALLKKDMDYILSEGVRQQDSGAHVLDINVGMMGIDETELLQKAVCELQSVVDLPLQIDTSNFTAMEAALRRYNGKALINSVNGTKESMEAIFPLVKKYGGVVIALTLDENGIPETADGRFAAAKRILETAAEYGIGRENILFDPLAMAVSADNKSALATLNALRRIKNELGCGTALGVSNISFGLPDRNAVNSVFYAMALENGLDAAMINPCSDRMMQTYRVFCMLHGLDENCSAYINAAESFTEAEQTDRSHMDALGTASELQWAVIKGFKDKAGEAAEALLKTEPPMSIVSNEIIPALNTVGVGFENKSVHLPQLLMSAEAAKSAFEVIKSKMPENGNQGSGSFVIATVHGDIHDIGKNIVKLLLENYGFNVIDLGKDVPPEKIVDEVVEHHAPMAGLSALMTSTVPAMEETIKLLRDKAPWCKIVVGGAVLTKEFAAKIGADQYAGDAMETVRFAESVIGKQNIPV